MNKKNNWTILIIFIVLINIVVIGCYFLKKINNVSEKNQDQDLTYTLFHSNTLLYDTTGSLSYEVRSNTVRYFAINKICWFNYPIMTIYNKNKISTWLISSDNAMINHNNILYLCGHVEINTLIKNSNFKQLKIANAQINLNTQDITSEDQVTIYGRDFCSTGMKIRGNLRKKTVQLLEKVKTSYYKK